MAAIGAERAPLGPSRTLAAGRSFLGVPIGFCRLDERLVFGCHLWFGNPAPSAARGSAALYGGLKSAEDKGRDECLRRPLL